MLGSSYAPARDPLTLESAADIGRISVYAQGQDYHDVVKKGLKALARWLIDEAGGALKVFVDTAPVMEKPLAQAAGLGWQGKHSNLVSRRHGKIGRAHVCTPVTNAHLVCRLLLEKKKKHEH